MVGISIHALLAESDSLKLGKFEVVVVFLSTLSLRRATQTCLQYPKDYRFLSTLSLRRATYHGAERPQRERDFYPRSPCGERRRPIFFRPDRAKFLSTLSLRRATLTYFKVAKCRKNFYPRSPCGERLLSLVVCMRALGFLSTLSLRRATPRLIGIDTRSKNFYPRSPCGERQYLVRGQRPNWEISIHALLAESDTHPIDVFVRVVKFLSTLSLRRATQQRRPRRGIQRYFYPRSPCGERRD